MDKYTITFSGIDDLQYPDICPGCLSSDLKKVLRVYTDVSIPLLLSISISKGWPVCANCAELENKKLRLSKYYLALGASLCLAWVCLVLHLGFNLEVLSLTAGLLMIGPATVALAVFSNKLEAYHHSRLAKKMGIPIWKTPIKLLRFGKEAFKPSYFLQFICYHEGYALRFMQVNEGGGRLKVKPHLEFDPCEE